ncbi:MAG: tetraacyldisaccharide 4'-kinase, partial [Saprospiraceae bacterium]
LLPSGRLREWRYGHNRAQVVIVTKCQKNPDVIEEQFWRKNLNLKSNQHLFFSTIQYAIPYNIFNSNERFVLNSNAHIFLISAIAQSNYLSEYLLPLVGSLTEYTFEDHHYFNEEELQKIIDRYLAVDNYNKWIITTEKDATRLVLFKELLYKHKISVFALPIEVNFFKKEEFNQLMKNYLLDYKS